MTEDAAIPLAGTVLVVCTANVCRSPLAAAILADALSGADVSSAGVRAMTDAPMCEVSASVLAERPPRQHSARQLTADLVAGAGLVLTMERDQRSAAVRLAPGSQNRVFTLREAAALAAGLAERGSAAPTDVVALARAMHGLRGLVVLPTEEPPKRHWWSRPVAPDDPLTIVDGHGADADTHLAAAEQVAATARRFVEALHRPAATVD